MSALGMQALEVEKTLPESTSLLLTLTNMISTTPLSSDQSAKTAIRPNYPVVTLTMTDKATETDVYPF